jgi:hypothetical protein
MMAMVMTTPAGGGNLVELDDDGCGNGYGRCDCDGLGFLGRDDNNYNHNHYKIIPSSLLFLFLNSVSVCQNLCLFRACVDL